MVFLWLRRSNSAESAVARKTRFPSAEHFFDAQGRREHFVVFPGASNDLNPDWQTLSSSSDADDSSGPAQKIKQIGIGEINPARPAVFGGGRGRWRANQKVNGVHES